MPTATAFAVAPNPDADALFAIRDVCTNPDAGYELDYPEVWWTNTEIGDVPACSWFSPTFYEVPDPSQRPPEIAIEISLRYDAEGLVVGEAQAEVGRVDGQPALRGEIGGSVGDPPDYRAYQYVVLLGPSPGQGPNLVAYTDTTMGGDYALNKAVLDRIMATLKFVGSIQ